MLAVRTVTDKWILAVLQVAVNYPTAIFVREKAIVINLERLRLIISRDQCIILSAPHSPIVPGQPGMHVSPEAPFVKDLVMRLQAANTAA